MVIVRAERNIGPFKIVETLPDRLRCDGVDYPFIVIGDYTLSDDDSLAPVVPPPELTREDQVREIRAEYDAAVAQLEAMYYVKERETWPQQVTEARAYTADPDAITPLLDAMLIQRAPETKQELVVRVMTNYALYSQAVGAALGRMQVRMRELDA
jgi:hypothetical protein